MRRAVIWWLLVLAILAPTASGATCAQLPAGWAPDVDDARLWAEQRRGTVSIAVRTEAGGLVGWQPRRTVNTASILKPMLLVAYLNLRSVRDRPLTDTDRRLLVPMIRRSDDAAAVRVRAIVGEAGLYRVAHAAGMRHFRAVSPHWGASRTDAADQTRFFLHLERYVPERHRATVFHLLRTITPVQRWGIGRVPLPGWMVYFKGGWGDGDGDTDHQVALLRGCDDTRVAVAVMTKSQGTHLYGQRTLEGVFGRLLGGLVAE